MHGSKEAGSGEKDTQSASEGQRFRQHLDHVPVTATHGSPSSVPMHIPLQAQRRGTASTCDDTYGEESLNRQIQLTWKHRIKHFTWTWFTMTMATGGIANVLDAVPEPYRFPGLYPLGCIFFLLNICLFVVNICAISLRFYYYPFTFRASLTHPTESLFVPALVISFGTILLNISQYGVGKAGPWLADVMIVMFWVDCALAVFFSWGIFLMIWSTTTYTIAQMTPVWIFPAYPLLIIGPHASNLAAKVAPERGLDIIVGGFIIQGIGFLVSLMVYSAFIYRLMTQKLPVESARPAMFISVGPSGFTISGIVGMGNEITRCVSASTQFMGDGEFTAKVTRVAANWVGLWLWGLALWFFLVAVGAHFSAATRGKLAFSMTWFSFVFPNTALTTATFAIARALDNNRPIEILGLVMTVGLIILWLFVFSMMIRSVVNRQILWPQKQEDRDEGGWNGLQRQRTWEENKGGNKRLSITSFHARRLFEGDEEGGPHDA